MNDTLICRYQNLIGFLILSLVIIALHFSGGLSREAVPPAYAAAADVKGSPHVAIGFYQDEGFLKVVYADGHVGNPPAGATTVTGSVTATGDIGGTQFVFTSGGKAYSRGGLNWTFRSSPFSATGVGE